MGHKIDTEYYQNRTALSSFLKCISKVIYERVLNSIRESPAFGLMIDETADISNDQKLIVYISYWDKKTYSVKYVYFKLIEIKSKTAESIFNELMTLLQDNDLSIHKLAGISTDGASSMVGCHSGVSTRFIDINPYIIATHCLAHRLNLVSEDAFKLFPDLIRFETTVREIYSYFKRSSKRHNELKEFQQDNDEPLLVPLKTGDTRWSSLYNAVKTLVNFISHYYALLEETEMRMKLQRHYSIYYPQESLYWYSIL